MVLCRTLRIGRIPITGFVLTADKYSDIKPFTTTLHISYPAGANKTVSIVTWSETLQTCAKDVLLGADGKADVSYDVKFMEILYAMLKETDCCTSFSYPPCAYSNYIQFSLPGNIDITSIPTGAEVFIDGVDQKVTTPVVIKEVLVGIRKVTLKLTGWNDYNQDVEVKADQTVNVIAILVPAEGCIYFTSSPQGARIFLSQVGQTLVDTGLNTPDIICGKSFGDYAYKLKLSGYEDKTGIVTLVSGHGEIVSETLRGLPVLSNIIISPLNPSVAINTDQQFSATPLDQYGNPIAATVTWSSSNTYVGIIDPNTGMFSALRTGTSVITASSGNISKTTTVTVTPTIPVLTTIIVSPATASIVEGAGTIFTASTLDQFNNPISVTITWASSNPSIGTMSQNGVFLAISQGTTIIAATSGTISGVAIANVIPSAVTPPTQFGIFGNINTAALILAGAMIGSVMLTKYQKVQIEQIPELLERK